MKKFTLADTDDYNEGYYSITLEDIPDCKGKYDIADKDDYVNDWDWLILSLYANIDNFDEISEVRETENPKYNFVWTIIQDVLKNDKTHEDITTPYTKLRLTAQIYPTFIVYSFDYNNNNDVRCFSESNHVPLSVEQTVMLLESGIFTDIVDNRINKED